MSRLSLVMMLAAVTVPVVAQPPKTMPVPRRSVLVADHEMLERALPRLSISPKIAARVGRRVALNEMGGNLDAITAWNGGENFASVGIGHFIWFPAKHKEGFEESFPKLVNFMRARGVKLPPWLDRKPVPHAPWSTQAEFQQAFHGPQMVELRRFLHNTIGVQTEFLVVRAQEALPRIVKAVQDPAERTHVVRQLNRLVRASPDLYPLIDYINFKGEGIKPSETTFDPTTGRHEGWGLRHALIEMKGSEEGAAALVELAQACKTVLDRRIRNHPASMRWREGWHRRCDTYRRPLRMRRR